MLLKVLQTLQYSVLCATLWALPVFVIISGIWFLRHRVLVEFVGDAASYLTAAPQNIAARNAIRNSGFALLEALHKDEKYQRVIIVGHSLGSVVGYDILNFFWARKCAAITHAGDDIAILQKTEETAALVRADDSAANLLLYRNAQRDYSRLLATQANANWRITDFVTLGSPLAHGHVLLVDDRDPLNETERKRAQQSWIQSWHEKLDQRAKAVSRVLTSRIGERVYPICPPEPDGAGFTYQRRELAGKPYSPHHAAVFAAVRWTNIFAPRHNIFWGDVIGGPAALLFGPGVKDIAITGTIGRSLYAHTKYWQTDDNNNSQHLDALRRAINLFDEPNL